MTNIFNCNEIEYIIQEFTSIVEDLWNQFSKLINITKRSKVWWNKECNKDIVMYHMSKSKTDWIRYRKTVKLAKRFFFDNKIQEIVLSNKRLWNLLNWVRKHTLSTIEAIKFNGLPCNNLDNLWNHLH